MPAAIRLAVLSPQNISAMLMGFGSVPSSGRPAFEITVLTSGRYAAIAASGQWRTFPDNAGRQVRVDPDRALVEFGKKSVPSFGASKAYTEDHNGDAQDQFRMAQRPTSAGSGLLTKRARRAFFVRQVFSQQEVAQQRDQR